MGMTLVEAQRMLLGIINSVEAGVTTPEDAVSELADVKKAAPSEFKTNYTLEDFQRIQVAGQSSYEEETWMLTDDFEIEVRGE